MKRHLIAAAAGLVASFGAHALTPDQIAGAKTIYVAGASAQRITFAAWVQEMCTLNADGSANHNDLDVYFNAGATPGNNSRGYACTLSQQLGNFAPGTAVVIYKRDQSGSAAGIGPVNDQVANARLQIDASCTRVAANPSPVADIQKQSYNCASTANQIPDVGLADVEPARFTDSINLTTGAIAPGTANLTPRAIAQGIFGVVVNPTLYRALQVAQGLQVVDVPANQAAWTAADIANIPSLPSTFITTAFTGRLAGGPAASQKRGWNLVLPNDNSAASKTINILRRVEGSGTQAASNLFFLAGATPLGCANVNGASCSSAAISVSTSSNAVQEFDSSGGLEGGFATADSLGAYAIGVLGRENNPLADPANPKAYRYVKIDGVAPVTSEAQVGNYRFIYESTAVINANVASADVSAFFNTLTSATQGMGKAATLARADVDSQQGALALPTYSGVFADQPAATQKYVSAVSRTSGNSTSLLLRVK